MFDTPTVLVDLGQSLAVYFVLVVIYGFSLRRLRLVSKGTRVLIGGALFGLVGVFGMMTPLHVMPGVQLDARDVLVMLASPYVGGAASLVAAVIVGAVRLYIGGVGAVPGTIAIFFAAGIGMLYAAKWSPGPARIGARHLFLISHGPILAYLLIPTSIPQFTFDLFLSLVFPVGMQIVFGTVVLGLLLSREAARIDTENALAESESRFRKSFEASGVAMNIADLDGTLMAVNPAFCRMLGYSREELLGTQLANLTHPLDRQTSDRERRMLIDGELSAHQVEKRYLHRDGHIVWGVLSRSLLEDAEGNPLQTVGHVQDVTERKRAEEALRRAHDQLELRVEERTRDLSSQIAERKLIERALRKSRQLENLLRETAESANGARSVRDALKSCLDSVCQSTGWPIGHAYLWEEAQPRRLHASRVFHIADRQRFDAVRQAIEREVVDAGEGAIGEAFRSGCLIHARIDRHQADARDTAATEAGLFYRVLVPVRVRDQVAAMLEFLLVEDPEQERELLQGLNHVGIQLGRVIERERASQQLRAAIVEADTANRTKSEFLANMSHELRSPLTAVLGYSEAIQQELYGPVGNEKYVEYIDHVISAGRHLHELINDILDVSAVEAGHLTLNEEPLEVSALFDSVLRIVKPRALQNGIQIRTQDLAPSPVLMADARRMKQVLVNLLSNAVKFTPPPGAVALDAHVNGNGLTITVADTGIGMDPQGIAKAMTKFGQVDSGLARQHEGTGLGLPLTKGLVEAHGGRLEIESALGQGTTVRIHFPEARVVE